MLKTAQNCTFPFQNLIYSAIGMDKSMTGTSSPDISRKLYELEGMMRSFIFILSDILLLPIW